MTLRRDRKRKKKNYKPSKIASNQKCPNCGEQGPHFAPPGFGSPGFYTCIPLLKGEKND